MLTTEPQTQRKKLLMKKAAVLVIFFFSFFSPAFSQPDSAATAPSFVPLQVTSFAARVLNRNVQLLWTVNSNEEVRNFEVERADDDEAYKKIGGRLSTGRPGKADYDFVDALPRINAGLRYRVKIVGRDGSAVYSAVQAPETGGLQCRIRQNPVRHVLELEVGASDAGSLQTSIYTAYGQKVAVETSKLSPGTNLLSLSTQNLLPGLHRLVVETGAERKVLSFVKE